MKKKPKGPRLCEKQNKRQKRANTLQFWKNLENVGQYRTISTQYVDTLPDRPNSRAFIDAMTLKTRVVHCFRSKTTDMGRDRVPLRHLPWNVATHSYKEMCNRSKIGWWAKKFVHLLHVNFSQLSCLFFKISHTKNLFFPAFIYFSLLFTTFLFFFTTEHSRTTFPKTL